VIYHNVYIAGIHVFQPPAPGVILWRHPVRKKHHFATDEEGGRNDGKCDWYCVLCDNCKFPVLIPETCIQNLADHIRDQTEFLEMNRANIGTPGCSVDVFDKLTRLLSWAKEYNLK
jgi:hypothetical protein